MTASRPPLRPNLRPGPMALSARAPRTWSVRTPLDAPARQLSPFPVHQQERLGPTNPPLLDHVRRSEEANAQVPRAIYHRSTAHLFTITVLILSCTSCAPTDESHEVTQRTHTLVTPPEFAGQLVSSSGVVFDLNSQLPPEQYTWNLFHRPYRFSQTRWHSKALCPAQERVHLRTSRVSRRARWSM